MADTARPMRGWLRVVGSAALVNAVILGACAVSLPAVAQQAAPAADRWAVVIGAVHPTRQYAGADAEAMYQMLVGPMGFKKENVRLLTDRSEPKPTLQNVNEALGTFLPGSAKKDDTVIIFVAGLGAVEKDPRSSEPDGSSRYLIVADTDPSNLRSTAQPMKEFENCLEQIEAERVVVFVDASYSGARPKSVLSRGRVFRPGMGSVPDAPARPRARVVITSSRSSQPSLEATDLGHSIFTYYLVAALKGDADLDRDGIVTVPELYDYVQQQVSQKARAIGKTQHPMMWGEFAGGAMPLANVRP